MFADVTEKEIREVVNPMQPSVLLYEIVQAERNFWMLAKGDEDLFSAFGKRAQVLLGFTEIGAWTQEGPLVPGGKGTGRRFDHQDEDLLLAARILEEKGLLDEMQRREPFWYVGALRSVQQKRDWSRETVTA